ncbi:hypothetical protein VCV18_003322 [Metarhizium anisopliae]
MSGHRINEDALKEGAYLPKTYTLCLEKGEFHAQPYVLEQGQSPWQTPKFQLRLTFDPSLYPPAARMGAAATGTGFHEVLGMDAVL